MTEHEDGGSAFPRAGATIKRWEGHKFNEEPTEETYLPIEGMSLRDYFAAKAMPEAIAYHRDVRAASIQPGAFDFDGVAEAAYRMADAMLKARVLRSER